MRITERQLADFLNNGGEVQGEVFAPVVNPAASKHGNERVKYNGIWFDSLSERDRYAELILAETAGAITDLKAHPVYELQPAFVWKGKRIRAITYEADFSYVDLEEDGHPTIVEDVKGHQTAMNKLKLKMMLYLGIEVTLIWV